MSNKDWYAKRLGNTPPASVQQRMPQQQPNHPVQQVVQQHVTQVNQQAVADPPQAEKHFLEALNTWGLRGGEAARTDTMKSCPNCGTHLVFGRQNGNGAVFGPNGVVAPAPRCFECGWNGKFVQANQGNWA